MVEVEWMWRMPWTAFLVVVGSKDRDRLLSGQSLWPSHTGNKKVLSLEMTWIVTCTKDEMENMEGWREMFSLTRSCDEDETHKLDCSAYFSDHNNTTVCAHNITSLRPLSLFPVKVSRLLSCPLLKQKIWNYTDCGKEENRHGEEPDGSKRRGERTVTAGWRRRKERKERRANVCSLWSGISFKCLSSFLWLFILSIQWDDIFTLTGKETGRNIIKSKTAPTAKSSSFSSIEEGMKREIERQVSVPVSVLVALKK